MIIGLAPRNSLPNGRPPGISRSPDGPLLEALEKPGGAGEDRLSRSPSGPSITACSRKHAKAAGIDRKSFGPHALRATAATNALDRGADLAQSPGVALGTPACPRPASTTGAAPALRMAPPSAWRTEGRHFVSDLEPLVSSYRRAPFVAPEGFNALRRRREAPRPDDSVSYRFDSGPKGQGLSNSMVSVL